MARIFVFKVETDRTLRLNRTTGSGFFLTESSEALKVALSSANRNAVKIFFLNNKHFLVILLHHDPNKYIKL
jgi:hypothetical protein